MLSNQETSATTNEASRNARHLRNMPITLVAKSLYVDEEKKGLFGRKKTSRRYVLYDRGLEMAAKSKRKDNPNTNGNGLGKLDGSAESVSRTASVHYNRWEKSLY